MCTCACRRPRGVGHAPSATGRGFLLTPPLRRNPRPDKYRSGTSIRFSDRRRNTPMSIQTRRSSYGSTTGTCGGGVGALQIIQRPERIRRFGLRVVVFAEGFARAVGEALHASPKQGLVGPGQHRGDEQAFRLGLVLAHPVSAESFENQLQPTPTRVRERTQQHVKVAQTSGQEPGYVTQTGAGVDEDPGWRQVDLKPPEQHDEGVRHAFLRLPVVDSGKFPQVSAVEAPRGVDDNLTQRADLVRRVPVMVVLRTDAGRVSGNALFQHVVRNPARSDGAIATGEVRTHAWRVQVRVEDDDSFTGSTQIQSGSRECGRSAGSALERIEHDDRGERPSSAGSRAARLTRRTSPSWIDACPASGVCRSFRVAAPRATPPRATRRRDVIDRDHEARTPTSSPRPARSVADRSPVGSISSSSPSTRGSRAAWRGRP